MVITGVSGLMGANLALEARRTWDVTGFYNHHAVHLDNVECLPVDLTRMEDVIGLCDRLNPAVLVHLAACTNVDWCEEHPNEAYRVNVETTKYLAQWAARSGSRFLFMSTDSVFDGLKGGYVESDPVSPLNCYAATKCGAETAVREAGPRHLIIRANIYGWNLQPKLSLAEWILSRAETGREIPGFTDIIFAPILVNTLAEIIFKMLELDVVGTFHVAGSKALSKYDFAKEVVRLFGCEQSLVTATTSERSALRARRPSNTWLRTDKLQTNCGVIAPPLQEDLIKFKKLRDSGKVICLKSMSGATL